MNVQKSQKGRLTAAKQLEEISHRKSRPHKDHPGRQQFGGPGTVPVLDKAVDRLSGRTSRAIYDQVSGTKQKSGGRK